MPREDPDPVLASPMAIVGVGCRFPGGADSPEAFWRMMLDGTDAVGEVPPDRWDVNRFFDPDPARPGKHAARHGGFLSRIDLFDPAFFGISPREAAQMDPQQRLLLEVAWEALEDAGQAVDRRVPHGTGVFVGVSGVDYNVIQMLLDDTEGIDSHTATGTAYSILANRISHAFNFTGPSLAIDTACSSSLVALHLACASLQRGECERAVAGGVNVILNPRVYVAFSRLSMLAADGRCRAFDAAGSGFVRAEGAGVVVLKTLARAIADGDPIRAVVSGTGVNQDGRTPGITMPDGGAQRRLVEDVCRRSGIAPGDVSYIEAHGPGTPVGDPIEARSLSEALCRGRAPADALVVGSVKTNIGHLEPAAGIAGVIKAALVLQHRAIPGNLHFEHPNPEIDFDALRLRVPRQPEPWPEHRPLVAGVDSFGFGGTNAHALLSAAPDPPAPVPDGSVAPQLPVLVCLSAHSETALAAYAAACRDFARSGRWDGCSMADIAHTSGRRRAHHARRLGIVAADRAELAARLDAFSRGEKAEGVASGTAPREGRRRIAFVYSGQGPQWWAMGRELLQREAVFQEAIAACDRILRPLAGWSIAAELTAAESESRIGMPAVAQPAIFCLQMALTSLWDSWGVRPDAVLGHSVGEAAAAWAGGILTLEDALLAIYHRGRCMQIVPPTGRMLAAGLAREDAEAVVAPFAGRVTIGAVNSPESVTLSGDEDAIAAIERDLVGRDVYCRLLKVNYAFHSHHMDLVRGEVSTSLGGVQPREAAIAVYSTVTGRRAGAGDFGAAYWWRNVREPVRFADAMTAALTDGCDLVIEVGPHPVLAGPVKECATRAGRPVEVVPSLRRAQPERAVMLASLGALYAAGVGPRWEGVHPGPGRVVPFPAYTWDHERYWHQSEECRDLLFGAPGSPLLGRRLSSPVPTWESRINTHIVPFLGEHRIHGDVILPATAYVEFAAAAAEACGLATCVIEDLRLHKALFLPRDADVIVQTRFDPEDGTFSVHARASSASPWQVHATAVVLPGVQAPAAATAGELQARFRACGPTSSHYAEMQACGFDCGPAFLGVTALYRGDGECLAEIGLPASVAGDLERYRFHPAAFDGCLQGRAAPPAQGRTYLPVRFGRIRLFGRPAPHMWSHAFGFRSSANAVVNALRVLADDGALIADVEGFEVVGLSDGRAPDFSRLNDLYYDYRWVPAPLEPTVDGEHRSAPAARPWVIFDDEGGTGSRLADALSAGGSRPVIVTRGERFSADGPGRFRVRPGAREDARRVFQAVSPHERSGGIRAVVYLWALDTAGLDEADGPAIREALADACMGVVGALQEIMADEPEPAPRLWIVTRGAAAGTGLESGGPAVGQAPLWGLGRVAMNEYPPVRCTLVDLDDADTAGADALARLAEELAADGREDEVAFRAGVRHVHRYGRVSLDAGRDAALGSLAGNTGFRLECLPRGSLDHLRWRECARRAPGAGEIEIEVHAAGLNFRDVMQALNLLPGEPDLSPPLGIECAGVVARVGSGVGDLAPGTRVMAFAAECFASHVLVRRQDAVPLPEGLSIEDAAAVPAAFVTARFGLIHEAGLAAGERVLIHSASGGVGLAAIQVARFAGAEVFATAGTPEKRAWLRELGVAHVYDSRSLSFADEVMADTGGEGVDVVLNSLAGEALAKGLAVLRNRGRFVELGVRDMQQNRRLAMAPFRNNLAFYFVDFARVKREEPQRVQDVLRDVSALMAEGTYSPLPVRVFPASQAREAFRLMAHARHTGKIVLSMNDPEVRVAPPRGAGRLKADATYLITGGLGGFGLLVARWMVRQGARHLVLTGRSGAATGEQRAAVRELERAGASVVVAPADVSREADVAALLARCARELPPLAGLIHAAMVIDDCVVPNLTRERLTRVLDPKVLGARHLDRLTRRLDLDFFVLFSSCSSILGLPGQANYNAANAFLDALAWSRRAAGLPATVLNWGFLGQVGYAASHQHVAARFEAIGVPAVEPEEAVEALSQALHRKPVQLSVLRLDWGTFLAQSPSCAASPRFGAFAPLARREGPAASAGPLALRRALAAGPRDGALKALEDLLRDEVARVVGAPSSSLDSRTSLGDLGFDSLMAVELRNWAGNVLGVHLRTMEIMRGPTIGELAETLVDGVRAPAPTGRS